MKTISPAFNAEASSTDWELWNQLVLILYWLLWADSDHRRKNRKNVAS